MSFINVESDNFQFRLILGEHITPAETSQIQTGCTGIMFEGCFDSAILSYDVLTGSNYLSQYSILQQFEGIRKMAIEKAIPVGTAEPLITPRMSLYLAAETSRKGLDFFTSFWSNPLKAISDKIFIGGIAEVTDEIQMNDSKHKRIKEIASKFHVRRPHMFTEQRNFLMAARAYALAEFQSKNSDIDNPSVVIACGVLHIGIADALTLTQKERIRYIKGNSDITGCYQSDSLGQILYATYNPGRKRWRKQSFVDRSFN